MKIAITGSAGLLGWHAAARLHARNCAACFRNEPQPFEIIAIDRAILADPEALASALEGVEALLHYAGVNRGSPAEIELQNPAIAQALVAGCRRAAVTPHVIYANSTHAASDSAYGRSKRIAGEILAQAFPAYTDLVLPHIFGEGAKPDYNNVTATFIDRLVTGQTPEMNPAGHVDLLHAGEAAEIAIEAALTGRTGTIAPKGRPMSVGDLFERLSSFHADYSSNLFPDLSDAFDIALFNSYRSARYTERFPRMLKLNSDPRGTLFEASRSSGGGGQAFMSWTHPGVTRGDHFHLRKVERFLVVQGKALIRIRRVLGDEVWAYPVDGESPAAVDMPTMHTHSIENIGDRPLLTLFWTNEVFNPADPDTYADPVLESA